MASFMLIFTAPSNAASNALSLVLSQLIMVITEVYDIVSKEKTKEVLGSQNIPNPSGKEEKGYTTSWGGSTGGSGNGNGNGSGAIGPGGGGNNGSGSSKPENSAGGCINSNHSDSNTSGHNYRSACIYEWEQGA